MPPRSPTSSPSWLHRAAWPSTATPSPAAAGSGGRSTTERVPLIRRLWRIAGDQAAAFEPGGQAGGEFGGDLRLVGRQVRLAADALPAAVGPLVQEALISALPGHLRARHQLGALPFHRLELGGRHDR